MDGAHKNTKISQNTGAMLTQSWLMLLLLHHSLYKKKREKKANFSQVSEINTTLLLRKEGRNKERIHSVPFNLYRACVKWRGHNGNMSTATAWMNTSYSELKWTIYVLRCCLFSSTTSRIRECWEQMHIVTPVYLPLGRTACSEKGPIPRMGPSTDGTED